MVDYDSLESLESAFRGQDVIVSTTGGEATLGQKLMIDAAIKAGVKRFIPSDFGSLTTDPAASHLPHHIPLVEIQKYLQAKAEEGLIEYTIFSIGAFTDFILNYGMAFDWKTKSAEVWGDGNNPISTTSLAGVGKAIAGALKNPVPTKNRNLHVHELIVTQAQLLALAKKIAPDAEWNIKTIEDREAEFKRFQDVVKAEPNFPNIIALVKGSVLGGLFNPYYENVDNDLVGLELLSEKDLEVKFYAAFKDKE